MAAWVQIPHPAPFPRVISYFTWCKTSSNYVDVLDWMTKGRTGWKECQQPTCGGDGLRAFDRVCGETAEATIAKGKRWKLDVYPVFERFAAELDSAC
jgi:hypothetical protein